ncbi:MAG: hypothetical protein ABIZ91_11600, partial [Gemmatimonadaceae bacterium]
MTSPTSLARPPWRPLRGRPTGRLVDARLQLHHAAQLIVAAPIAFLAARDDDSHTALSWLPAAEALGTEPLDTSAGPRRVALHLADLTLLWLD